MNHKRVGKQLNSAMLAQVEHRWRQIGLVVAATFLTSCTSFAVPGRLMRVQRPSLQRHAVATSDVMSPQQGMKFA
eukprot:3646758-Amphidinium_carterae.1